MEKTICIFGDSITWGAWDSEMGGWVNRLKKYLEKDEKCHFEVYNLGVSGDNSDRLLKRFFNENEARNPDIIIIAIGINDSQYIKSKNDQRVPLNIFESNLLEIINQARKFTKEIIFVGPTNVDEAKTLPIPWNTDRNYSHKNISLYDGKIKEICEKNKLLFVEMMDLLDNNDLEDGLHPNAEGHEKIYQRVKDYLVNNKLV
jgi:lysophospholipase L1-like esterase